MRTLAPVAGGALPGEEAEGTVPRVLELAVRHPRLLLLTCSTSQQTHQIRREHSNGGLDPAAGKWPPPTSKANPVEGRGGRQAAARGWLTCGGVAAREGLVGWARTRGT